MTKKSKGTAKAGKKPRAIRVILRERAQLDAELGLAISTDLQTAAPDHADRPTIKVKAHNQLTARIVKNGVTYGLAVNKLPLPFQEKGVYPLTMLGPGVNGLVWLVFPTKKPWAFQVQLLVDGNVFVLDQHTSAEPSTGTTTIAEQQPIELS